MNYQFEELENIFSFFPLPPSSSNVPEEKLKFKYRNKKKSGLNETQNCVFQYSSVFSIPSRNITEQQLQENYKSYGNKTDANQIIKDEYEWWNK